MAQIEIKVNEKLSLDAGTTEEQLDQFIIHPPAIPMIDQLITHLDTLPDRRGNFRIEHQSIGFTAICVRWGTYLATLMDPDTDLHPAIPGFNQPQPQVYSFISNAEMKRINIEVSFNLYRLIQIFRERGYLGLAKLIWKAYDCLPMPHQKQPKNREMTNYLFASVFAGSQLMTRFEQDQGQGMFRIEDAQQSALQQIAPEDADRFLANLLACNHWRNTIIEEVHSGIIPPQGLQPHQQRFTKRSQQAVLREVTANFGSILFAMDMLFDENYHQDATIPWPQTATALANSFYSDCGSDWSLTDSSSAVVLRKSVPRS